MNKKQIEMNIDMAKNFAMEINMLSSSLSEDVSDSASMTEAWNKIDKFYKDIETLRNSQKCTGSKSFSILNTEVEGHTKYLQGINLPIIVNSIVDGTELKPSTVSEMHIGNVDGKCVLLITPDIIG